MYLSIKEMENNPVMVLEDGRVFIDYGPVSMVITARNSSSVLTGLAVESFSVIPDALRELAEALPELKQYTGDIRAEKFSGLPRKMVEAACSIGEPTLTPMATVAGAMSDLVADWLTGRGAETVIVNNGGDIAIRIGGGETVKMGILADIGSSRVDEIAVIKEQDKIGGVCTSGLGGRSFTRGIANAVTVFSKNCIQADACATHIANTSYLESPRVQTALAGELEPSSDIAGLGVVTQVGTLTDEEISQGLAQMKAEMQRQLERGNLIRATANIQGRKLSFP